MIGIKGLTMPTGCTKCPYIQPNWKQDRCRAKSQKGKKIPISFIQSRRKPTWCPLVEVKEGEQE